MLFDLFAYILNHVVEACVAKWLTPQTPDLELRNSSLTRHVVSFDRGLYSTVSLLTHMYK